ncbi:MAG: tripartite tricarboxylate transporter substrate binding protein, partial [Betaproteobacteria bacterium]|nr:tripartite tricarboxylate transporter substrate binding protein [Betaproteobacteria bacterium]
MHISSRHQPHAVASALFAAMLVAAFEVCAQAAWKPDKAVEFIVGFAPGGGNDKTARTMHKIWQDTKWLDNVGVVNKVGGGGAVSYAYTNQHPGDAHYIATFSPALIGNRIMGTTHLNYLDFTPLNILVREYVVLTVKADSPIASLKDLTARLKKDSQSVSFA